MRVGQHDSAAATQERSVAMYRETRPAGHPGAETALLRLATAQLRRGQLATADSSIQAVLGRITDEDSSQVRIGQALQRRGSVARRRGQWDRADSLYAAALQSYRAAPTAEQWRTALVQMQQAQGRAARGDSSAAAALLTDAYVRLRRERGTPDHYTKQVRAAFGALYEAWGRPPEAARVAASSK